MIMLLGTVICTRKFSTSQSLWAKMKVAIIGQSMFGMEVYNGLRKDGHKIVGIFTIPDDKNGRPDPLAKAGTDDGIPVFKFARWRQKGQVLTDVLEKYKSVGADLNVMPFCSQFIPMEVVTFPKHQSIIYHPSILPRHRGASAINWTLMCGDVKGGFTIFWADDGLDTGPILLQKETTIDPNDTVDTFYNRFCYPDGIKAMRQAVQLIADGKAPRIPQPEKGSTYDPMWNKKENAKINWTQTAHDIHNFIRGSDHLPGAWSTINGEQVTFYGSQLWKGGLPAGDEVSVDGMSKPGVVHNDGMILYGKDGDMINVKQIELSNGKMMVASKFGKQEEKLESLELTSEEEEMKKTILKVWSGILQVEDIQDSTDFFSSGAGSMDVARLVEEIKEKCGGLELENDDVYLNRTFEEFLRIAVLTGRGETGKSSEVVYDAITMNVNNMEIKFPHQLFIDGEFVDSSNGVTYKTINPNDESAICELSKGTEEDVDRAVKAAERAFYHEWRNMNARDRGKIMYKLADLMEEHKEELATIESIDSGAVYTLALKTHVGMSIDVFRYMAGWCDKIHGQTIPINHAKPLRNLTFTKREPIGVCGIVTPWNYPLMMLAWKMSACLAAGNTVVLKPAQVSPLTALKFAELSVKAGFPRGVINILPGAGSQVGQAIADHPRVRKLGFTGSTGIGKQIMKSCAVSNVKKCSLELGGKSPLIIFGDCDMDRAVRQALGAVFFNKGENCIAAGRLFVAESIHDQFVERIVEEVKKMKIGDPLDRSTAHGPQNHKSHLDKLLQYCERGEQEGATLVYGGKRVNRPGLFMMPTVFTDVEDHMFIAEEESFGPVMIISKFEDNDLDGVISRANNSEFGLASGVFTKDIGKAMYVQDNIEAGTVFINTYNKTDVAAPFGGFKQSGFGKDLGEEALNDYLKTKTVTIEF